MNKKELLENYTMEQLADKVIALEIAITDMKNTEKIIKQYNNKQCECGKQEKRTPFTDKELAEKWEKLAEELNDEAYKLAEENERLKIELQRKETTISQIDDILSEIFGVVNASDREPDDLKGILEIFINTIKDPVTWLMQMSPIKVASILINSEVKVPEDSIVRILGETQRLFNTSELQQIAGHLLVYCNANEEDEEC